MLKTDVPENLDPLYMDDLRSLCRKLNLPDTGRRNTLCRRLKLHKKQMSPPVKQDQRSKEPDPVALPKTGLRLTWLTKKQKNRTYLIYPGFNPVRHRKSRESNDQESVGSCKTISSAIWTTR